MSDPLVVAITGASGAVYAKRLLEVLYHTGQQVHLSISTSGRTVLREELGIEVDLNHFEQGLLVDGEIRPEDHRLLATIELNQPIGQGHLRYFHQGDFMSPMASGSAKSRGMVVCPCSGGTLSGIVHGTSSNLIQRAAEVHLKEHRKLILVPRETPLSLIAIDNMRKAAEAGAVVMPAMPGWYHGVTCLEDLIDFMVARILDQLDIPHALTKRWGADV